MKCMSSYCFSLENVKRKKTLEIMLSSYRSLLGFNTNNIRSDHIEKEKYAEIEWEGLGFDVVPTDFMYQMKCSKGELFSKGSLIPYGNIELSPFSGVLNYGQVLKLLMNYIPTKSTRIMITIIYLG